MSEQVIGSDDQSLQLSSRLAKKLSKQVPPYQNSYFKPFYKNLGLYYEKNNLILKNWFQIKQILCYIRMLVSLHTQD